MHIYYGTSMLQDKDTGNFDKNSDNDSYEKNPDE